METILRVCSLKVVHVAFLILHSASGLILAGGHSSIGICYGFNGENFPPAREVVSICKSHGIKRMRLYEPNATILECLRGSGIEVVVGLRNEHLIYLAKSYIFAKRWIEIYIRPYARDIPFRYITVGNEAIPGPNATYVLRTMRHLNAAVNADPILHPIKVSTVVSTSVLRESYRSSNTSFSLETLKHMKLIAQHLSMTGTPLLANLHPYLSYIKKSTHIWSEVSELKHSMLFHEQVDALHEALTRAGEPGVQIVVSETGWPSAGHTPFATPEHAESYLSYVIKRGIGPYRHRRQQATEIYLYAMFNENKIPLRSNMEQWGLFSKDKKLILNISFT